MNAAPNTTGSQAIPLRNESGKNFTDISTEGWREYVFPGGEIIRVDKPQWLSVAPSGGHRLLDINEVSHYIPKGWIHLRWQVWNGAPHFVK